MKKTITSLTIMLAFIGLSYNTNAQWTTTAYNSSGVNHLAAVGSDVFVSGFGGVYKLTNNGGTSTAMNAGLPSSPSCYSIAVQGATMYVGLYANGVYKSTDNGSNWTVANTGIATITVQALAVSGASVFAGTNSGGVFRSMDNGVTWTAVNTGITSTNVQDIAVIGTSIFVGTMGGLFRSTDNGDNWTLVTSGIMSGNTWALGVNGTDLYVAAGTRVHTSTDNGATWTDVLLVPGSSYADGFAFIGTNAFVGTDNSNVSLSQNGGAWVAQSTGLTGTNMNALVISGGYIYAGGSLGAVGVVWKRPLSEMGIATGINSLTNQQSIDLYPIPSADGVFNIALKNNKTISLKVYNLLGELMHSESIAIANTNHTLNLSHLPTGIYTLQVTDGASVNTQKIVIQK